MFFEEKLFRVTAKVKYDIVIRRKVSYSQYRILCAGLTVIVFSLYFENLTICFQNLIDTISFDLNISESSHKINYRKISQSALRSYEKFSHHYNFLNKFVM